MHNPTNQDIKKATAADATAIAALEEVTFSNPYSAESTKDMLDSAIHPSFVAYDEDKSYRRQDRRSRKYHQNGGKSVMKKTFFITFFPTKVNSDAPEVKKEYTVEVGYTKEGLNKGFSRLMADVIKPMIRKLTKKHNVEYDYTRF